MLTVTFIGCGRLGKTIAYLIANAGVGAVKGILNSTYESGQLAAEFIGSGSSYSQFGELPTTDVYFITTQDEMIEDICVRLISEASIKAGTIIIHCSGSLTSDVLQKAKQAGCLVMNVHPIKSFANPTLAIKNFSGTYCGYEGDEKAFAVIDKLFTSIGGILFSLKKEDKKAYHAAGVIANNCLVGLHHTAVACYKLAGVNESMAYKITSMLMRDALQNLEASDHKQALTGPLQRGDKAVILNHLAALSNTPLVRDVYAVLGKAMLAITTHSAEIKTDLQTVFEETNSENSSCDKKSVIN